MLGVAGVAAGPFDDLADETSGGAGIETPTEKGFWRSSITPPTPSTIHLNTEKFYLGPAGEETC